MGSVVGAFSHRPIVDKRVSRVKPAGAGDLHPPRRALSMYARAAAGLARNRPRLHLPDPAGLC